MFYSYNPTKILNGIGAFDAISKEIFELDDLVVVHGQSLALFDDFLDRLTHLTNPKKIEMICIPNSDPSVHDVIKVAKNIKGRNPFLLGVGGGRVMDFTKALAVISGNNLLHPEDIFTTNHFSWKNTLPLAVISTRPGSGSEFNNAFILSDQNDWKTSLFSLFTYPKFCIHDPVFFKSLDSQEYRFGLFDAVIHVLDQYVVDRNDTLIVDELALSYLRILGKLALNASSPIIKNYQELAWLGSMISSGILKRGVDASWRCHELVHAFSSITHASHGVALTFLSPSIFEKFPASKERYDNAMNSLAIGLDYRNDVLTMKKFIDLLFANSQLEKFSNLDIKQLTSLLLPHCPQYSQQLVEEILWSAINE
jgi:NADP-dependent alcohol dehydrogenase